MNIESITALDAVLPVLISCDLPVSDISASAPPQFFGVRVAGSVVAVIGMEEFQPVALLRSLAVNPAYRGQGLAQELVAYVESLAASRGIESIFLLTTTAEAFFAQLGYRRASRSDAPQAIQATAQFSGVCPSSAAFLFKRVTG
jgi:amino-acid N-acetyltransferase